MHFYSTLEERLSRTNTKQKQYQLANFFLYLYINNYLTPLILQVQGFTFHESGASAIACAPRHNQLITAGKKGVVAIWDLRQQRQVIKNRLFLSYKN